MNLNLGMLLGELGRLPEAEQAFRTALKSDPQSAAAAYNLGVLVAEQDLEQAIELCRTARPSETRRTQIRFRDGMLPATGRERSNRPSNSCVRS